MRRHVCVEVDSQGAWVFQTAAQAVAHAVDMTKRFPNKKYIICEEYLTVERLVGPAEIIEVPEDVIELPGVQGEKMGQRSSDIGTVGMEDETFCRRGARTRSITS